MGIGRILGRLALFAIGGIIAAVFGRVVINVIDGKPVQQLLDAPKQDVALRIEFGGPEGAVK